MATALGIVCLSLILAVVNSDGDVKSESDLRKALFENYDKLVRPVRNAHDVVPVRTLLYPVGIKDVDVKDHIVKIDTWFYMKWVDQFLSWDPSDYGGLQALRVHADEIWRPDLAVYFGTPDTHLIPTVHTNVVLYYNGTALWIPPFSVKSRCYHSGEQPSEQPTEQPTEQPADGNFHCTILVGSWTYDVSLLEVEEHVTDALLNAKESYQDTNHEWTLESMTAHHERKLYDCCTEEYSLVKHDLVLKRRHSHQAHQDAHHDHHDAHHDNQDSHKAHQDAHNAHQDAHNVHQDAHQDGDHAHHDS